MIILNDQGLLVMCHNKVLLFEFMSYMTKILILKNREEKHYLNTFTLSKAVGINYMKTKDC